MEEFIMTPHNSAEKGAFASTVLMPGDPLRAKYIAENFLENAQLVNNVRGVNGYTGTYHGKRVSVMASGMGMPSIGIYSYELFNVYDVKSIIRVGSAGAISPNVKMRDIVIAMGASYQSEFMNQYQLHGTYAPCASYRLLKKAADTAEEMKLNYKVGSVVSGDVFYSELPELVWAKMGVLAGEMECAALYAVAARAGKEALCMCTISDIIGGDAANNLTPEERQSSFDEMIRLALGVADE